MLSPEAVQAPRRASTETFEFFERGKTWDAAPERFRLHAVAVQRAADRLAAAAGYAHRDRLLVTALLHDVGKLVLMHAYPGYPKQVHGPARTPEERLHYERRELGVDHALVGGVLARRWNLPRSVASAIERHHADDAQGDAAFVRLADMLAHYSLGIAGLLDRAAARRARRRLRPRRAAHACSTTCPTRATRARARSSRARSPRASSRSSSASPRAWSTSRSRTSSRSPPARCARTCTTSTASSAPSTAPRPCCYATERGWL